MSRFTILALVTDAFGGYGGIAQYNRDLLSAIAFSAAASPTVVLPRHAKVRTNLPAGIIQKSARFNRTAYALSAMYFAVRYQADIVFCGHLYMAPLAALIARIMRAKLIIQMHGVEAWPKPAPLQRAAVEGADLILCVSRYTRASVLNWASIVPERIVVLPNTVGERFTPGARDNLRFESDLQRKKVLLTAARMDAGQQYKGHDRVIASIPELVRRGHDIVYLVVGEGDDRPRLETFVHNAGVAARVRFLGSLSPERLVDCYRMADLFVMPSTGEGFGIAYLEAMASGTPALGLKVAGASDALADGELGAAVAEAELPDAIARLLASPKPDPNGLSKAVRARFGRDVFRHQVRAAIDRFMAAA